MDIKYYGEQVWDFSKALRRTDSERINFLADRDLFFNLKGINASYENNKGYSLEIFTIPSQHMMGNDARELIDAAMYCAKNSPRCQWDLLVAERGRVEDVEPNQHEYPGVISDRFQFSSSCIQGCGCYIGTFASGGPDGIDPLGKCPNRPGE